MQTIKPTIRLLKAKIWRAIFRPGKSAGLPGVEEPALFLLMAAWFGLITGLGEAAGMFAAHLILHRYEWRLGPEITWIIPSADIVVFLIPGFVLYGVARCRPRLVSLRFAALVMGFLSCASLLLMLPSVGIAAKLVLAAGLAVQVSRFVSSHPRGFCLLMSWPHALAMRLLPVNQTRRPLASGESEVAPSPNVLVSRRQILASLGGAAATVGGLAAGTQGWQALTEARALARLPRANRSGPNVLLIVLDAVRAADLSLYGYQRTTTPLLKKLASTGVRFEQAISTAPWTLPSHAGIFTGRYHHELSVGWTKPFDGAYPTLAEAFRSQGYLTAGFAANPYYLSRESGLDRGFDHYEAVRMWPGILVSDSSLASTIANDDRTRNLLEYYDEYGRKGAADVSRSLLAWLSTKDPQRPFFAFLNYYDAHDPYLPPKPYDTLFAPHRPRANPLLVPGWPWSQSQIQIEQDAYDGSIAYLDRQLGLLHDELQRRKLLDDTLLVIVGDHGEEFYEHGVMGHGSSVYLRSVHVPLLINFPSRIPQGLSVRAPVTLRDLPATIVDLARIDGQDVFPGTSLATHWTGAGQDNSRGPSPMLSELEAPLVPPPASYPVSKGAMKSLVVDRYHYIRNGDGREELYDILDDRLETRNLAETREGAPILRQMRSDLDSALVGQRV